MQGNKTDKILSSITEIERILNNIKNIINQVEVPTVEPVEPGIVPPGYVWNDKTNEWVNVETGK